MTTIKIHLPLLDPRACTGCPLRHVAYCYGFPTKRHRSRKLRLRRFPRHGYDFARHRACLDAEVGP